MKAVVVGSGGWGTALSIVLCDNGHDVTLWSHNPAKAAEMAEKRENPLLKGVTLPDSLTVTGDLSCLEGADWWCPRRPPSPSGRPGGRSRPTCGGTACWCPCPRASNGTPTSA